MHSAVAFARGGGNEQTARGALGRPIPLGRSVGGGLAQHLYQFRNLREGAGGGDAGAGGAVAAVDEDGMHAEGAGATHIRDSVVPDLHGLLWAGAEPVERVIEDRAVRLGGADA